MYSAEDEQQRAWLVSREAPQCVKVSRQSSDDLSSLSSLVFSHGNCTRDAGAVEALSRILVAKEQFRAEVRIKEIDAMASVEKTRLTEGGSTERCRIVQEQQSLRFNQMAGVMDTSVKEGSQTVREVAAGVERTRREAIASLERVDTLKAKTLEQSTGSARTALVVLLAGVVAARPGGGRPTRRHSWIRRVSALSCIAALYWAAGRAARAVARRAFRCLIPQLQRALAERVGAERHPDRGSQQAPKAPPAVPGSAPATAAADEVVASSAARSAARRRSF